MPSVTNEWQRRSACHSSNPTGALGLHAHTTKTDGVKVGASILSLKPQPPSLALTACGELQPGQKNENPWLVSQDHFRSFLDTWLILKLPVVTTRTTIATLAQQLWRSAQSLRVEQRLRREVLQ